MNIFLYCISICFASLRLVYHLYTLYVCLWYFFFSFLFLYFFFVLLLLLYFTEMTSNISLVTLYSLGTKSLHNAGLECFFFFAFALATTTTKLLLLCCYAFASFRISYYYLACNMNCNGWNQTHRVFISNRNDRKKIYTYELILCSFTTKSFSVCTSLNYLAFSSLCPVVTANTHVHTCLCVNILSYSFL